MSERANNWSVTINMKTISKEKADEFIQNARQSGWTINGQLEQGEQGTEHYQLHVKTPQIRFSAVKKMFPTAHIEVARNVKALKQYVNKAESRIGALPEKDEKYVTSSGLWLMVYREYKASRTCDDKDAWLEGECADAPNGEVRFYHESDQRQLDKDPLAWLDKTVSRFIRRGIFVDQLITNPAIRSFWKKFYPDILYRARQEDRQTDRQAEILSRQDSITDEGESQGDSQESGTDTQEQESDQDGSHYDSEDTGGESEDGETGFSTDDGSSEDSEVSDGD